MTDYPKTRIASLPTVVASGASQPERAEHDDSHSLATTIAQAAEDRKGADIVVLDVSEVSYLADYFVIITGFSSVQVRAIARSIEERTLEELNRTPRQVEGQGEGTWVLMDYGDAIVHIFMPEEREFYNLEAFWGHANQTQFSAS